MEDFVPVPLLIKKAEELIDRKEYRAANVIFSVIQEVRPDHPHCLHGMGVLAIHASQNEIAIQLLSRALNILNTESEKSLENDRTKSIMLANLGRAYEQSSKELRAMCAWTESLSIEHNEKVDEWLRGCLRRLGEKAHATVQDINNRLIEIENNQLKEFFLKDKVKTSVRGKSENNKLKIKSTVNIIKTSIEKLSTVSAARNAKEIERLCVELMRYLPAYPDALHWMGISKHYQYESEIAIDWIKKGLDIIPNHPFYHNTLGVIQRGLGYVNDSITSFHAALSFKPDYAEAAMNLGNVLRDENRFEEAKTWYRLALYIKPDYAEAWNNLGVLYKQTKNFDLATDAFSKVLSLNPKHAKAYLNLGVISEEKKERKKAIEMYKMCLDNSPETTEVRLSLLHQQLHVGDWSTLENETKKIKLAINESKPGEYLPFNLMPLEGVTANEQKRCAELFCERRYSSVTNLAKLRPFTFKRKHSGRIKVGFLSTDFRDHAVGMSIVELIELIDRRFFEVFAYSLGPNDQSLTRSRLINSFDKFQDIDLLGYHEAADKIYSDQIDILIDLTGHTSGSRFEILALHPAPLQAAYLGYSGTLGAPFVEYLIGDQVVTPIEHEKNYTEKLVILPDCYFPTDRKRTPSKPTTRYAEGIPEDRFVLCSFNQPYKIGPTVWKTWCEIMGSTEDSVLWLHSLDNDVRDSLLKQAENLGIKRERIIFATKVHKDIAEHLARLQLADLALDTFPYGGHTTTHDALWAGVPVITLLGDSFHSRVAASMNYSLGLEDLVAKNLNEYKFMAKQLICDNKLYEKYKEIIKINRIKHPLFNTEMLSRNFEKALFKMYRNWIDGGDPRTISI